MCKVVCFKFACGHHARLRSSRCGGTYHKVRRDGRSVACSAEAYIDRRLTFECGPCQQNDWEAAWTKRLERAHWFLDHLPEKGLPGYGKIFELVRELEDTHNDAAWQLRTRFPPARAGTSKVAKVEMGPKLNERRKRSLLSREIKPEDIASDSGQSSGSCDGAHTPAHRTVSYNHPLDSHELPAWLEEAIQEDGDAGGNLLEVDTRDWDSFDTWTSAETDNKYGYDVENEAQVQEVIKTFWEAINDTDDNDSPRTTLDPSIDNLTIRDSASYTPSTSDNESARSPSPILSPHPWTDGSSDSSNNSNNSNNKQGFPTDIPSIPTPGPSPGPVAQSQVSTAKFDKMRAKLKHQLQAANPDRFYAKWLQLNRMEICEREAFRPDPRRVPAPPCQNFS